MPRRRSRLHRPHHPSTGFIRMRGYATIAQKESLRTQIILPLPIPATTDLFLPTSPLILRPARLHRLILVGMSVMSRRTPPLAQFVLMSGRSILGMIRRPKSVAEGMGAGRVALLRTLRHARLHRLMLVGMSVMSGRAAPLA